MKEIIKNNLNLLKKASLTYGMSFGKTIILGIIFYLIFIILGITFLSQKEVSGTEDGFFANISTLVYDHVFSFIALIILVIISPFFIYTTATQYALNKTINFLANDRTNNYLDKIFDSIFSIYKKVQPDIVKNAVDFSREKINLLNTIDTDYRDNPIVRKITRTIIEKLQLEELGLTDENKSFYDAIKETVHSKILEYAVPSLKNLYILLVIQIAVLLFIYFFQGIN